MSFLCQVADLSQTNTTGPTKPRYVPPHLRGKPAGSEGSEKKDQGEDWSGGRGYGSRGGYEERRNDGGGRVWDDSRGSYARDDRRDGHQEDRGGFGRR